MIFVRKTARRIIPGQSAKKVAQLSCAEARTFLLGHLGLNAYHPQSGARGVRETLKALRAIQLDPLDPMGTNADLVVLARVNGVCRGERVQRQIDQTPE